MVDNGEIILWSSPDADQNVCGSGSGSYLTFHALIGVRRTGLQCEIHKKQQLRRIYATSIFYMGTKLYNDFRRERI